MTSIPSALSEPQGGSVLRRLARWFSRHWFATVMTLLVIWTGLPFLAPIAMHFGWTGLGTAIYSLYSLQCHQLPERSLFLFGSKAMYSLPEIQAAWVNTVDPLILRQFIGNPAMGWKVAWSDRMVAMYTSIPLLALVCYPFRRRIKPLPLWGFALLLLPLALDGGTHMLSDLAGIGPGFRDSNAWLATLTGRVFPASFYAGDALGSFNSWTRLTSGVLFGIGIVWLAIPHLMDLFRDAGMHPAAENGSATGR